MPSVSPFAAARVELPLLRRDAAARLQLPLLRPSPTVTVWLDSCESQLVDVTDEDRREHRRYLESVVAEDTVFDRSRMAATTAQDGAP